MSHQQPSLPPQSLLLQPLQSQPHPGQPSLPQPAQQIHQPVPQPAQRLRILPTTLRQPEGAQVPRTYIIPYNDAGILEADSLLRFIAYYTRTGKSRWLSTILSDSNFLQVVAIMPEVQIPPQDLYVFHQLLESLLDHCDNAENDLVFICNILQAENVVRRFLALVSRLTSFSSDTFSYDTLLSDLRCQYSSRNGSQHSPSSQIHCHYSNAQEDDF